MIPRKQPHEFAGNRRWPRHRSGCGRDLRHDRNRGRCIPDPRSDFLLWDVAKNAQGTSIATLLLPIGIFAFWTYYKAGHVDLKLALLIAVGFAAGGWFGGLWAQHLSDVLLRRGFAVLLVILAVKLAIGP